MFLVYSILLVKAWEYALSALCEHVLASRDSFCKNKTDHSFMVCSERAPLIVYSIDKLETIHSAWPASVNSPKPQGSSM